MLAAVTYGLMTYGNCVWESLLQQRVPRHLLGRASSADWLASFSFTYNFYHLLPSYVHSRLLTHTWSLGVEAQFYLIFPFLLVMWSLTGALYPAVDLCAGEKERGTMETLLISPASREEIVWGKFLTIWVFSSATAVLNLFSMGITTMLIGSQLKLPTLGPMVLVCVVGVFIGPMVAPPWPSPGIASRGGDRRLMSRRSFATPGPRWPSRSA